VTPAPAGRLAGKVALVTGAARGIGRACAIALSRAGADLALVDIGHDLAGVPYPLGTASQLTHTARLARDLGAAVLCARADVRDQAAVTAAVTGALDRFGRVDVVVNNAGIAAPAGQPVHQITAEQWQLMLDVDVSGAWRVISAVGAAMTRQRAGSIVNVSSTAGLVGYRHFAGYVTAKHALIGLTRAAALDFAPAGVRVNALCPGSVRDDPALEGRMLAEIGRALDVPDGELQDALLAAQPGSALVAAADVADAVVWLGSDETRHVTGTVITVDGGFTAR
jgi:NAD(P)-dependent dehydrogenase (short-subunit alcohol dehydrogenase family)